MRKGIPSLFVILLVACGSKTPVAPGLTAEQVTIRFAVPDWELQWGQVDKLVKEFEAQNPNIRIELVSLFSEVLNLTEQEFEAAGLPDDLWSRLAASADTFQVLFYEGLDRQADGLVRDLKPLMDADPNFHADDFYPGILEAAAWDGGIWALPIAVDYQVILFDKEAFDAAKVAYPAIGWTWDDFRIKAQALTAHDGGQVTRWGFVPDNPLSPMEVRLVELRTGPLLDDATNPPTPRFTEADVVQGVQWWVDLALKDQAMPHQPFQGTEEVEATWVEQGIAAMQTHTFATAARLKLRNPQKLGVAPIPVDTPSSKTTPLHLTQVAMSAGTAHPEAAWRWLDFLSRQSHPFMGGEVPARRSVAETGSYWDDLDDNLATTLRFALDHAHRFSLAGWGSAYEAFDAALQAILAGGKSVKEALADAQVQAMIGLEAEAVQRARATPVPVVVATAESETPKGTVTISFALMNDASDLKPFRDAARQFHAAHPDLAVEIETPGFTSRGIVDVAGQFDCFQSLPYLDNPEALAAILSLEPFLAIDASFDLGDFFPLLLSQYQQGGQTWGLPAEAQFYIIEYNKDLFDAADLAYPEADWTLDDFLAVAQDLTRGKADDRQYGFVGSYETLDLVIFVERLGGQVLDDTQDPPAAALDNPATIEAVRWYANLSLLYGVKPLFVADEEREALIDGGRAAMWATPFDRHKALRSGVVPFPQGTSDSAAPLLYTTGYFISAQAAAPQACWEWIKFLTGQVNGVQGFPARRSVATSDAYCRQVGAERAAAYLTSVEGSQRPSAFQRLVGQEWLGAYLVWLEQAYKQIVEEGKPVEEALVAAQEKADAYRACVVANRALDDPHGYRACLKQVDPAYSENP